MGFNSLFLSSHASFRQQSLGGNRVVPTTAPISGLPQENNNTLTEAFIPSMGTESCLLLFYPSRYSWHRPRISLQNRPGSRDGGRVHPNGFCNKPLDQTRKDVWGFIRGLSRTLCKQNAPFKCRHPCEELYELHERER